MSSSRLFVFLVLPLALLFPALCSIAEIENYESTSGQLKPSDVSKIVLLKLGRKAPELRLRVCCHEN